MEVGVGAAAVVSGLGKGTDDDDTIMTVGFRALDMSVTVDTGHMATCQVAVRLRSWTMPICGSANVSANLGNANAIFVTGNMEVVEWKVFDLYEGLVFPANMKYPLRPLTLGALAGAPEGGMIYTN